MYPVIVRRLADLRVGDRLITHSGLRYPQPLRVTAPLGPVPDSHGRGVRVANPTDEGEPEWVIYPWQMDGQVLEVDRPAPPTTVSRSNAGISARSPKSAIGSTAAVAREDGRRW